MCIIAFVMLSGCDSDMNNKVIVRPDGSYPNIEVSR